MRARAPGKLLLSGAYSVLEGAVAIGLAVDRYAVADSEPPPDRVTEEVRAAVDLGLLPRAVWFDASALRDTSHAPSRKLGLGSSAAVLVASLAAALGARDPVAARLDSPTLGARVLGPALDAHRRAQPRGSGVDVALSCLGGALRCRLDPVSRQLRCERHALPRGLALEAFACPTSASTAAMLEALARYRSDEPEGYRALLGQAQAAAERAAQAEQVAELVAAVTAQYRILGELGRAAAIPIVEPAIAELARIAAREEAAFGPAGAGGGDIAFFAGPHPPSESLVAEAARSGLRRMRLGLGGPGVHFVPLGAGMPGAPS